MAPPDDGVLPEGVTPPATQLLDRRIEAALEKRAAADQPSSTGGSGGDGGSGSLEARVAKLEASLENVDKTLSKMEQDIKSLRDNARTDFRQLLRRSSRSPSALPA